MTPKGGNFYSLLKVQSEIAKFNLCRNTDISALRILKYYNQVLHVPMS